MRPHAEFTNDPIPVDRLPQLTDVSFVPVDPRYLRARLVGLVVSMVMVLVIGGAVGVTQAEAQVVAVGAAIVLLVFGLLTALSVIEVRRLAYQLREHDISLRSGVITHRTATIPFSRVQHVNLTRGPIERIIGLASLEVTSAGPNLSVPGLTVSEAERIEQLVSERAGVESDGEHDP